MDARKSEQRVSSFTNELKSALLSVGSRDGQFGVKLGDKTAFRREVDDLVSEIKTQYSSYSKEIYKSQKIKELNKGLVMNFRKNLQVMVDVTNLLNSYVELFNVIKVELVKMNNLIGKESGGLEDIRYLEEITQRQITQLNNEFVKQSATLESLYSKYDLPGERQRLSENKLGVSSIINSATDIVETLPSAFKANDQQFRIFGGKQTRSKKAIKKQK